MKERKRRRKIKSGGQRYGCRSKGIDDFQSTRQSGTLLKL